MGVYMRRPYRDPSQSVQRIILRLSGTIFLLPYSKRGPGLGRAVQGPK